MTRLLTVRRVHALAEIENRLLKGLLATIDEMADSPTFLIAASPKRIPLVDGVKNTSLTLTSGGRIAIPISRHSLMYFTIFSWLPRSLVRIAAMK